MKNNWNSQVRTIIVGLLAVVPILASFDLPLTATHESYLRDTTGCSYKGFKLYGKIQVVDSWPDIKVQIVESFPDLKVKVVENFPDDCGEWQFVDSWPDLKVQFVEHFPDIKIKFVESFPGKP